jgi:hypothetical protein
VAELVKKMPKPGDSVGGDKPTSEKSAGELRTFTRRDGRSAKLRFVKLDGENASFVTAAGKTYVLSLDSLSDADQAWIREHAK